MKEAFLIDRGFYPLDKVEKTLGISEHDLIHLAAWRRPEYLPIHILTSHLDVIRIHVDRDGALDEYPIIQSINVRKLSCLCLQEFEAGNSDAEVSFDRQPFYEWDFDGMEDDQLSFLWKPAPVNGYWHTGLRRKNVEYPLLYEFRPRRLFDSSYPKPIKISECKMVVLAEDLERFQNVASKPSKPNGHEERHAKNREEVLGAALAVVAQYPGQCKTKDGKLVAAKIAGLIEEKSYLFWPETLNPPLKKEKITRLVSDWISKTMPPKNGK